MLKRTGPSVDPWGTRTLEDKLQITFEDSKFNTLFSIG